MPIIYQPKGKAREYCSLAANLYNGCGHGCTYCYVPIAKSRFSPENLEIVRRKFHRDISIRKDALAKLEKDAPKHRGKEVHFSFYCDPYQRIDTETKLTRAAIKILLRNNIHVNILTKGGMRSARDFDLMATNGSKYGATLTFMKVKDSIFHEPFAAFPQDRIEALRKAKERGIYTWVSLEPVIDPAQTIELVEATKDFIDEYKVGRWNYAPMAEYIHWSKFLKDITRVFKKYNIKHYIKNDLQIFNAEAKT
ncbi:MAG: radical SAM protein [Planctomycetes bacterium]|nr:radical SAM protein [Planctomycetota bacterium]